MLLIFVSTLFTFCQRFMSIPSHPATKMSRKRVYDRQQCNSEEMNEENDCSRGPNVAKLAMDAAAAFSCMMIEINVDHARLGNK